MNIKDQLNADLKTAMLAGDKTLATTLRGLKSAILYAEVAAGNRDSGGLDEATIQTILAKEAKKRQESADLYERGGRAEQAAAERAEKAVIEKYLPAQLSDEELAGLVDQAIAETGAQTPQDMGPVIGKVKQLSNGQADGGRIAAMVKEKLAA